MDSSNGGEDYDKGNCSKHGRHHTQSECLQRFNENYWIGFIDRVIRLIRLM